MPELLTTYCKNRTYINLYLRVVKLISSVYQCNITFAKHLHFLVPCTIKINNLNNSTNPKKKQLFIPNALFLLPFPLQFLNVVSYECRMKYLSFIVKYGLHVMNPHGIIHSLIHVVQLFNIKMISFLPPSSLYDI